jgi:conjugative relaxase-like TrwC/TraI family protein
MLRITQNTQAGAAKSYYSTSDYYTEGQELAGRWRGEAAHRLGLQGTIKQAEWDALCDNRDPHSGEQLTARRRADRTVGYDFNFHVPKSVSLLYATTRDERILEAFRKSVDETMRDMEAEMLTRVRKKGSNENRTTGNMAWGEFIHFTSRPVDGVPDPHLHAHCFVFNTTFDPVEERWKAGQFRELNRDAPYFEAVFHSRLAGRLDRLGLPIERTRNGWELGGIDKHLVEKFSRRTAQIEEKARELGIDDAEAKSELGAKTREKKQKGLTFPELQNAWRSRMTEEELQVLATLEQRIGGDAEPADANAPARAVEYARSHVFERKSVVAEREFLAEALWHSVGQASVEQVTRAAGASELIAANRDGRRLVTAREVLAEEARVISYARDGRGTCAPFVTSHDEFKRDWLNKSQKNAVRHILGSRDRIILVRGAAGVGKTTLMQEAVEGIEERGTQVFAFAPSSDASRGTLRAAGFKDADTVARLLVDEKLQQQIAGQLIWIDEAGQLGMKAMSQVFELAERHHARVLLSGDKYQHGSVERGAALKLLETEAGLVPAEVKEILRQSSAYKEAVKALSEGRAEEGFRRLDGLHWIKEIPSDERYIQMAADYVESVTSGKNALAISPTHAEGDRITAEIRRALKSQGKLGDDERKFVALESTSFTEAERGDAVNYAPGDVLVFHQNARGFTRGDRLPVAGKDQLPLDQAKRFQVHHMATLKLAPGDVVRITRNGRTADGKHDLRNGALYKVKGFDEHGDILLENGWRVGKDWGFLDHGYVVTSHTSQGKTVDRVLVGQGSESFPASSREQFYTSVSRGRERVTVYTDDKEALLDAVSRSDERLSATELVRPEHRQEHERLPDHHLAERRPPEREEMTYER